MPRVKVFVKEPIKVLEHLYKIQPWKFTEPYDGYTRGYYPTFDEGGFEHDVPVYLHATKDGIIITYRKADLLPIHRGDPYVEDVIIGEFEELIKYAEKELENSAKPVDAKP